MNEGLAGVLFAAGLQQRIAEAFHYDTYAVAQTSRPELVEPAPRPNSPGYRALWPYFQRDALVAMRAAHGLIS